jgi:chorismate dehydratase
VRILAARRFGIDPAYLPAAPDLSAMLASADAALLIGDEALFVDHRAHGAEKIDLGAVWSEMTGLPFVWAFWAGRPDVAPPGIVALLQRAAEDGMAHTRQIAVDYCRDMPERIPLAERYLREHLAFRLTRRALEGLETYYAEASRLGLAAAAEPLLFDAGPSAIMESDVRRPHR